MLPSSHPPGAPSAPPQPPSPPASDSPAALLAAHPQASSPSAPAAVRAVRGLAWLQSLRIYAQPAALRMLVLGFGAGLPITLVLGTLAFWLREAQTSITTIGFASWVGLAYAFKWAWSPLVDRVSLPLLTPWLGRRRSWLLLAQALVVLGLWAMASLDPQRALAPLVACAVLVAVASATQDIALDAFRIESAQAQQQGALVATYQTGYRLAMIWAGAGALWIAAWAQTTAPTVYQYSAWQTAYQAMALSMLPGMLVVLFSQEPARWQPPKAQSVQAWLYGTVIDPFADFIRRYRWQAVLVLSLIALYRISDVVMGIMANPLYVDLGYTKDEIATVTKIYGVVMTLLGAFLGGALVLRWGVLRVLLLGAVLSAGSNLLFSWLATQGHALPKLMLVISADNLSSGIATSAFVAYLSSLTNVRYSATQYALFSSLMVLLPKVLAGYSGMYVAHWGYAHFFTATALLGLPVVLLVTLAARTARPTNPPAYDNTPPPAAD